ncbi:hypothetical protein H7J77_15330 [Mycolicibacillus parakoreensis]|uniref:Uncharacterized protein n=1 Tax=Mycolicibacillus parakoreensis TaxID=1069221 RepID=A0ABY3TU82_9MYCO|nr:hypothetical protein [Mycolicibacillus parakoreensis]MCV7316907.1 hypothetical protein [Mycolicibacillus parakoreensis]ULN51258.1 hypothetical protein MIU77_09925 [Mycolicibacillus parakoreensis]
MFENYDFGDDDDDFDDDEDFDDDDFDDDSGGADSGAPKGDNSLKWALGLVTFLAVVATAAAATVVFGGNPDAAEPTESTPPISDIASADDDGPVSVIVDDPTCKPWMPINDTLASAGEGKWNDRDRTIPASDWTPEQQQMHMGAAAVLRSAAAQSVGLAKLTPHRVMRELYEQFIAYGRAYAERVPQYVPADNNLAEAANSAASALASICGAINDGSAASRGPLAPAQNPPELTATPADPTNPVPFLASRNPVCDNWHAALQDYMAKTTEWQQLDPNIAAILWNPAQKAVNVAAAQVLSNQANTIEQLGQQSGNATLQDFAVLIAQYQRAFVAAVPTYTPADQHLANAAAYASALVDGACTISGT